MLRNNRSPCQQSPPRTPAPLFRLPAPQEQGVSLPEPRLSGTQDPGLSSAPPGNPGPWELRCPEPWAPRTLAASSSRSPAPQLPTLPASWPFLSIFCAPRCWSPSPGAWVSSPSAPLLWKAAPAPRLSQGAGVSPGQGEGTGCAGRLLPCRSGCCLLPGPPLGMGAWWRPRAAQSLAVQGLGEGGDPLGPGTPPPQPSGGSPTPYARTHTPVPHSPPFDRCLSPVLPSGRKCPDGPSPADPGRPGVSLTCALRARPRSGAPGAVLLPPPASRHRTAF